MTGVRPIGYYVHHHGAGHRTRAMSIARAATGRIVLIGTGLAGRVGDIAYIDLPDDRMRDAGFDGIDGAAARPAALHYAPIDHPGIRTRVARIARWIDEAAPALMVVDVSAEIAMLARIASVPTVVVRLGGLRTDAAHLDAFRGATALMCPFAAALDDPRTPVELVAKTRYQPGLIDRPPSMPVDPMRVTVVLGAGGTSHDVGIWAAAATAVPESTWEVIGPCAPVAASPRNLVVHGWVEDAAARIAGSGVVVAAAGNGTISTLLAAGRPFICLPEERPFGEQRSNAAGLARAGAAILCDDPARADWRALIAAARALDPGAAAALDDPDGPRRAARWLTDLADGHSR